VPPYVGFRAWIGLNLDRAHDLDEIAGVIENAWRTIAPRRLLPARRRGRG
jgi:hypothetical protein